MHRTARAHFPHLSVDISIKMSIVCSFRSPGPDLAENWVTEFRDILSKEIARQWPKNRIKAQEASDLLDQGNRLIIAYERSGKVPTSTATPAADPAEDSFWDLPPSQWQALLGLKAERGPGPATLPAEAGTGRRRYSSWSSRAHSAVGLPL